jgi:hypothetical protein
VSLGLVPAALSQRFNKSGTIAPFGPTGPKITAVRAEHSSELVWKNPATDKEETHFGGEAVGYIVEIENGSAATSRWAPARRHRGARHVPAALRDPDPLRHLPGAARNAGGVQHDARWRRHAHGGARARPEGRFLMAGTGRTLRGAGGLTQKEKGLRLEPPIFTHGAAGQ